MTAVSFGEMLACAERELRLRQRNYPRWIDAGRMSTELAERELRMMEAIAEHLRGLVRSERLL